MLTMRIYLIWIKNILFLFWKNKNRLVHLETSDKTYLNFRANLNVVSISSFLVFPGGTISQPNNCVTYSENMGSYYEKLMLLEYIY